MGVQPWLPVRAWLINDQIEYRMPAPAMKRPTTKPDSYKDYIKEKDFFHWKLVKKRNFQKTKKISLKIE